jgi:hypothetical protein
MVRYEKGNFQSGYAMVENKKIIVVNKFLETEGRISVLLDIFNYLLPSLSQSAIDAKSNWQLSLSEKSQKLVKTLKSSTENKVITAIESSTSI